jgi:hypothetical protein
MMIPSRGPPQHACRRLAATLLDWIEQCDEIQDIDLPPQVKQIEHFLPPEVMSRIWTAWYRKAHQWDGAFI